MKNVFLIHGYNGIPKIYNFFKEELEKRGFEVIIPEFPPRDGVVFDNWYNIMDNYKNKFKYETIVIAHSIGNEFMIKYLSKNNININLFISLAGFTETFEVAGKEDLNRAVKNFQIDETEKTKFKKLAENRYSIYSDNDHIVPIDILKNFPKDLENDSLLISGIGHMGSKSGVEKIPEVINYIDEFKGA